MNTLTCEMCGSTDIMKQDGVFVCQVCGVKYSVEEARKMMVEGTVEIQGTVEVQGTVQVDNTVTVQKYLQNARRAKEKEDWEEVEKYYNLVEQNDPDNIEAIFYSSYGKAKRSLVPAEIYQRKEAFKVLNNSVSIIDDHYNPDKVKDNEESIRAMTMDVKEDWSLNGLKAFSMEAGPDILTEALELLVTVIPGLQIGKTLLNIIKVINKAK